MDRKQFAVDWEDHTGEDWKGEPHAIIDNKSYAVYLNGKARDNAARRKARGSYRKRTGGLRKGHVKPRKSQKSGSGRSVLVMAAVIDSKIRVWHEMDNWGGEEATKAYKGPLKTALKKALPRSKTHTVLEDNDPSGYKSGAGGGLDVARAIADDNPMLSSCLGLPRPGPVNSGGPQWRHTNLEQSQ